jgi:glycosyltransferase involved in cell wall biosynthesis
MTRVLALCSAADPTGSVKQFDLALPSLRERFDVVRHTLPADVKRLLHATKPDLVHTLGADAFRMVRNVVLGTVGRGRSFPKWVAAGAAAVEPAVGFAPGLTATISQSEHERDWAARLVPAPMQFSAPVGISPALTGWAVGSDLSGRGLTTPNGLRPEGAIPTAQPVRAGDKCILAAGGFDAVANLKHVVWAFDAVRYANPGLRLLLLGTGPLLPEVERFALSDELTEPVLRFLGHRAEVEEYFPIATQVWSTHTRGGTKFLLEAMASGVPGIAARTPDTERVIRDGANGRLVPVGQPVEMARVAHGLLSSPDRARALALAGQTEAARYPVADLANALAGVYHTLTSSDSPRSG